MKRKILMIGLMMLVFASVGCGKTTPVAQKNDIPLTMQFCKYDERFKGEPRMEQMFVENVKTENGHTVTVLKDKDNNLFNCEDLGINWFDDVLVLMVDNGTPKDKTDDEIVHCWIGVE